MAVDWQNFQSQIQNSRKILISSHAKADGDALGSELALAAALRSLGFFVTVLNPDAPSSQFRFFGSGFEEIRTFDGMDSEADPSVPRRMTWDEIQEYDTLIVADTSSRSQLRKIVELTSCPDLKVLVIDHHAVSDTLTPHNFSDSTQPAAGCLVMELIQFLGVPLSYREEGASCSIADCLFFAIATDTGWFRFPSVLPETMRQAAELMACGASTSRLYRYANENYSTARLKLLGVLAQNCVWECEGRLAYSWIETADFERFGAEMSDTSDLVNSMLTSKGVEVVVLFTEISDGFRLNFRSRGEFSVAETAHLFGGGGHKNAAGASIHEPLEKARELVISAIKEKLGESS